jgi:hypothetical protein
MINHLNSIVTIPVTCQQEVPLQQLVSLVQNPEREKKAAILNALSIFHPVHVVSNSIFDDIKQYAFRI